MTGSRESRVVPFLIAVPVRRKGQHRYQWTAEARDAADHTLAIATITKEFPPE
jgi:hypothetical protein